MVRIGTHSGTFHCDEALGCFLLKQTAQYKDADVVRTRDPKVLQDLDIVIDVGATYDPGSPRRKSTHWAAGAALVTVCPCDVHLHQLAPITALA